MATATAITIVVSNLAYNRFWMPSQLLEREKAAHGQSAAKACSLSLKSASIAFYNENDWSELNRDFNHIYFNQCPLRSKQSRHDLLPQHIPYKKNTLR